MLVGFGKAEIHLTFDPIDEQMWRVLGLPRLAAELVALRPDVLIAVGSDETKALQAVTSDIPIFFMSSSLRSRSDTRLLYAARRRREGANGAKTVSTIGCDHMRLALTVRPGSDGGSEAPAQSFIIKWQNEPKFNFKQSHICFSRKPCRFRDPGALAFVWRMPDARSVRASATRGGRESTQCLAPVHHSTRQ
jgi:hypothetical protein